MGPAMNEGGYVFPARQWDPLPPKLHPAPEVSSRVADEWELPRSAIRLREAAANAGWRSDARYARGTRPGRISRVVDSIAIRMRRGGVSMWAVWLDGKFDAAMIWRSGVIPVMATLTEVRKEIERVS